MLSDFSRGSTESQPHHDSHNIAIFFFFKIPQLLPTWLMPVTIHLSCPWLAFSFLSSPYFNPLPICTSSFSSLPHPRCLKYHFLIYSLISGFLNYHVLWVRKDKKRHGDSLLTRYMICDPPSSSSTFPSLFCTLWQKSHMYAPRWFYFHTNELQKNEKSWVESSIGSELYILLGWESCFYSRRWECKM